MTKLNSTTIFPFTIGLLLTLNLALVWAIPIASLGALWKYVVGKFLSLSTTDLYIILFNVSIK